jgi:uncharacterized protein YbbC (DUF1343 family)
MAGSRLTFKDFLSYKKMEIQTMKILSRGAKYRQMCGLLCLFILPFSIALAQNEGLLVGAERPGAYLPLLYGKKVGVVANQTSLVKQQHLVDYLLENDVNVTQVFAPEHGFRGEASAGEAIKNGRDSKTGLPIISLYGKQKKPSAAHLANLDVLVFDIQDVGARFYTYISTLSYVMEAAAENGKKVVVLDRPNPNGHYVDGPILEPGFESFVGLHPVPIVHGLTVGEYAKMVNGQGWLKNGITCNLEVITCQNYQHNQPYALPVKPSPNLPNFNAVTLYPSLCLFEGTPVSVGRGTDYPFQQIGAPWFTDSNVVFTPSSRPGAKYPPYEGQECYGYRLNQFAEYYLRNAGELYLFWLVEAYKMAPQPEKFFTPFFNKLAGNAKLQAQIKAGLSPEEIRTSWQPGLEAYKKMRRPYLLYP